VLRVMTRTENGINEKVRGGAMCIWESKEGNTNLKITMDA